MNWKVFSEINREILTPPQKSWKITFWKLAASAVATAGVVGAYWKAPDFVVKWLIQALAVPASTQASIEAWQHSGHFVLRTFLSLCLLGTVYIIAFAVAAQSRLDFRNRLAQTLGMKFLNTVREHDVLDLNGRCRSTGTEDLLVYDLHLSHIQRRFQAPSSTGRTIPVVKAERLPPGTTCTLSNRDDGSTRLYILNFAPPLHRTSEAVKLSISEEIQSAIWMYEEDVPIHPIFNTKIETISWFVVEPMDRLELAVTFPHNYFVGGDSQVRVRYGRTPTPHDNEETRLKETGIKAEIQNGRQTLRLIVEDPVPGLHYFLCWVPPKRPKGYEK